MKKVKNTKTTAVKKQIGEGELKKPTKLKPLKEKEKKGWKNKIGDDDDDFVLEDGDVSFNSNFDDDDDLGDDYYDDSF